MADGFEQTAERLEDLAIKGSRGGKAGGKRGRGGGGGGSNYGGPQNRDVQISKGLSTLLRHQAANAGIQLDDEGFANLDKVVSCFLFHFGYVAKRRRLDEGFRFDLGCEC